MNNKTGIWILLASLFIVVLLFISWQKFGNTNVSAQILTKEEAQKLVQDRYQGTVTQIKRTDEQYDIELEKGDNLYHISLDALSGKVLLFSKKGTKSQSPVPSTTTPRNDSSKKLTEEEVKEIAKKQVDGAVDHVWLETKGEQTYYLVQIKTKDDREAIVQIHAITGNVMSVTWDDHSSDDDHIKDDSKNRSKDDKKEDDD
jgi:uncharacterized membrane protein YkoI